MKRMIPLGPVEFSPADVALILAVLFVIAVCGALPVTIPLAVVGYRRAERYPGGNALWYWFWGTGLTVAIMAGLSQTGLGLGWGVVPLSWIPTGLIAVLAYPRRSRPRTELGWSDTTTGQGER
jgi:hypothetical protein